jgi:hypothetical protein
MIQITSLPVDLLPLKHIPSDFKPPIATMLSYDRPLDVSIIASPLPLHQACAVKTVFRVYLNNLSVALICHSTRMVLLEQHDNCPKELFDYLIAFESRNYYKNNFLKQSYLELDIRKISKR